MRVHDSNAAVLLTSLALLVALAAVGPAEVSASPASPPVSSQATEDSLKLADARYRQALVQYVLGDYDRALALLERTLATLNSVHPHGEEQRQLYEGLLTRTQYFIENLSAPQSQGQGSPTSESASLDSTAAPSKAETTDVSQSGGSADGLLARVDAEDYLGKIKLITDHVSDAAQWEIARLREISARWSAAIELSIMTDLTVEEQLNSFSKSFVESGLAAVLDAQHDTAVSCMKKLKSPPDEYSKTYDLILEMYSVYCQLVSLRQAPRGSLDSFNRTVQELDLEIEKLSNKIAVTY